MTVGHIFDYRYVKVMQSVSRQWVYWNIFVTNKQSSAKLWRNMPLSKNPPRAPCQSVTCPNWITSAGSYLPTVSGGVSAEPNVYAEKMKVDGDKRHQHSSHREWRGHDVTSSPSICHSSCDLWQLQQLLRHTLGAWLCQSAAVHSHPDRIARNTAIKRC